MLTLDARRSEPFRLESAPARRFRIGTLTNSYRPVINGVVNSIDITRQELLRQGHDAYLFAPSYPGLRLLPGAQTRKPPLVADPGLYLFPSLQLSDTVDYPLVLPYSPSCQRALSALQLDVLHTHHPFLLANVAVRYRRSLRIPLVYTFHTQYEQYCHYLPFPQAALRWMVRRTVKRFSRSCDLIIAPSPSITALLQEYGIRTWTETLPNAIDLQRFRTDIDGQSLRARLRIGPESVVALSAGRLGREKNLDFLLRCFAAVESSSAHLLLVGEGPEAGRLRALAAELGLGDRVTFAGRVDYEAMPAYYAAADLFAITSTTEVKPLVVLEALASGVPVVAVAACGTRDTVTHERDGLLCGPSESDYTTILSRALSSARRQTDWKRAARETSLAYGIENYVHRLLGFYQEATDRARR
jgi:1,2-diacylglycerol 3-alpha-glucosyltransferase